MTSAISLADLLRFFEATGHTPRWLDFRCDFLPTYRDAAAIVRP